MVNGISSNTSVYALKDLVNLAKYATGVPLTDDAEKLTIGQVASYPAMMCAYEGYQWVKNNKGNYKAAFANVAKHGNEAHQILKDSGISGVLRVADAKEVLARIPQADYLKTMSASTQNLYSQAQKLAEAAKSAPKNKDLVKQASSMLAKAEAVSYAERAKNATGMFAKAKNALGITKIGQASKNLAAKSPVFKKCLDAYNNESGNFMLIMQGAVETMTNVVPTFKQLGFKKGMKQLGRSFVKVFASVAGWVAGSALGSKAGEVIGAAIGHKKAGAVIGAIAGQIGSYACGTIGEHFANKGVDKVLGKSELEQAKENEAVQLAMAAQNSPEVFDAIVAQAAERLAMEGEDTAESKALHAALQNLVNQKNAAAEQNQQSARMMTREEMKAYADRLADNNTTNPNKHPEYKGYIPSSAPAPIKAEDIQRPTVKAAQTKPQDVVTPEIQAILDRADRVIANGADFAQYVAKY